MTSTPTTATFAPDPAATRARILARYEGLSFIPADRKPDTSRNQQRGPRTTKRRIRTIL